MFRGLRSQAQCFGETFGLSWEFFAQGLHHLARHDAQLHLQYLEDHGGLVSRLYLIGVISTYKYSYNIYSPTVPYC